MIFRLLAQQNVKDIHDAALGMLEAIGMDIGGEAPRQALLDIGATIKDGRACLRGELIEEVLSQIPKNGFEVAGRDGEPRLRIAPGAGRFRPAGGLPFVYDWRTERRREATMVDAAEIVKLADALDGIDVANCAASPADVGVGIHNVRRFTTAITYSTKPTDITASGPDEVIAVAEIALLLRGSSEALRETPLVVVYVSPTSPLRLSEQEGLAVMECARRGLPLAPLSCPTLGATAPITVAGAVAQQWAEELAMIALAYTIQPGLPIVACNRVFPMDMRGGNALASGADIGLAAAAFTELATASGLPTNSWGFACSSHLPDIQAGAERMLGAMLAALSGTAVISGAGTLSTALMTSPEQLVIDNEIIRIVRHALDGVSVSQETLAITSMKQGIRDGTFLATDHTLNVLRSGTLLMPDLFMSQPYETWASNGRTLMEHAHSRVAEILSQHEVAPLDRDVADEIARILETSGAA